MLKDEPTNLVLLKTYNSEFGEIITLTNQNGVPLQIDGNVNLTLHINQ